MYRIVVIIATIVLATMTGCRSVRLASVAHTRDDGRLTSWSECGTPRSPVRLIAFDEQGDVREETEPELHALAVIPDARTELPGSLAEDFISIIPS